MSPIVNNRNLKTSWTTKHTTVSTTAFNTAMNDNEQVTSNSIISMENETISTTSTDSNPIITLIDTGITKIQSAMVNSTARSSSTTQYSIPDSFNTTLRTTSTAMVDTIREEILSNTTNINSTINIKWENENNPVTQSTNLSDDIMKTVTNTMTTTAKSMSPDYQKGYNDVGSHKGTDALLALILIVLILIGIFLVYLYLRYKKIGKTQKHKYPVSEQIEPCTTVELQHEQKVCENQSYTAFEEK